MSTEELTLTQRLDRGATLETLAEEEGVTVRTIKRRLKAEADGQPAEAQPAAASRGLSDRQALILGALRGAGGGPISTASIAGSLNLGAGQVADAAWYLERKSPPLIQRQNTGLPEGERARFGWVLTDAGNAALDTASQG